MDDEDLESSAVVYLKEVEEQRVERHEENIQILAAIGILGGYLTVISTGTELSLVPSAPLHLIFGTNLLFLMYKLLITSPISLFKSFSNGRVDSVISGLYIVSVVGFATVLVGVISARQFDVPNLANYSGILWGVFMFGMLGLVGIVMYVTSKRTSELADAQADKLRNEFPETLDALEQEGGIKRSRKNALIDRLDVVLESDENQNWMHILNLLGNNPEPLRLKTRDRETLLNILGRIQNKLKYGEYDEQDVELMDEIISQAEERTRGRQSPMKERPADPTARE